MTDKTKTIQFAAVSKDWRLHGRNKDEVLAAAWNSLRGPVYRVIVDEDGGEHDPAAVDCPEVQNLWDQFWLVRKPLNGQSRLAQYAVATDEDVEKLTLAECPE